MSTNDALARIFEEMADVLELSGANPFRVNAHRRVARVLESLGEDAASIVARNPDDLTSIEGIGDGSAKKIIEFVNTGRIAEHDELLREIPPQLPQLLKVQGLGPKTVRMLWQEAGIDSIASLKAALEAGKLDGLPRLGAKTIANLRESLEFLEHAGERIRLGDAMPVAESLVQFLAGRPGVEQAAFAGSLRRGRETIGDLDLLVAASTPAPIAEAFATMGTRSVEMKGAPAGVSRSKSVSTRAPSAPLPTVTKVLGHGDTKVSVRLNDRIQADLRIVPPDSFGAALLYFTGSKEHNVRLRERAIAQGMRLNEYGLFTDDGEAAPQDRGVRPLASKTEEQIYKRLGLPWIPPELREDRGECNGLVPAELVSLEDIRCELHAHTTASDGAMSIDELVAAARARGFHTIAVTDHSRSSVQANGLSPERLLVHIEAVRAAERRIGGIRVLAGSEVDIHADGSLDYDDDLLGQLDIVIASPHASLRQEPSKATARLITAIRHPMVHIIGHPTGRIINGRPGLEPDMAAVVAAAREAGTALEVNAHHLRLDLRDSHVRLAVEAGVPIAINCDVHGEGDFDELRYGVMTARRGWLTKSLCLNAWPAAKLHEWLRSKRTTTSEVTVPAPAPASATARASARAPASDAGRAPRRGSRGRRA